MSGTCPARIAVDPTVSVDTGGPEALVQLALVLKSLCNSTFVLTMPQPIHHRFRTEYPEINFIAQLRKQDLRSGDVLIAPDVATCDEGVVKRGVTWYMWILSSKARKHNWRTLTRGCRLLSHNHWLAHDTLSGIRLQSQWQLNPYISPSIVRRCAAHSSDSASRRRLVLLDSDTPGASIPCVHHHTLGTDLRSSLTMRRSSVYTHIPTLRADKVEDEVERACAVTGCESMRVANRSRAEVHSLLSSAMVIVDW